ncbi:MAG: DUF3971 domain-containing protein [Ghiorsea sp.]
MPRFTSNRFLITLFLLTIPFFIALRWDSSIWLNTQIDQVAKNSGFTVHYDQASISGLGVSFNNLQLSKSNTPPIEIESIHISLSLAELVTGTLGADIQALWLSSPVSFTITQHDGLFDIKHIEAQLDMAKASMFMPNLIAKLSGNAEAQGSLQIAQASQQVQSVNLHLTWQQAMAGLAKPEFSLGDYQAHINSLEDSAQPWNWDITGGSGVALDGKGTMLVNHPNPNFWVLSGEVSVQVDQSNPSLAMMIQAVAGSSQAKVRLSGTLSKPKTVIIR